MEVAEADNMQGAAPAFKGQEPLEGCGPSAHRAPSDGVWVGDSLGSHGAHGAAFRTGAGALLLAGEQHLKGQLAGSVMRPALVVLGRLLAQRLLAHLLPRCLLGLLICRA